MSRIPKRRARQMLASAMTVTTVLGAGLVLAPAASALTLARTDFDVGDAPWTVVVADFDDDGQLDLATADENSQTITLLYGQVSGSFGDLRVYPTGQNPKGLAVGDFNNDGDPDLVNTNALDHSISVRFGEPGAAFGTRTDYPAGTTEATGWTPLAVEVGDVNLDGRQDLVVVNTNSSAPSSVAVLLGQSGGTFTANADYPVGLVPSSVAVGDLNGDGDLDLVVGNENSDDVSVLLGQAGAGFGAATAIPVGNQPTSVAIGDFNLDGDPDLAVALFGSNAVAVLLGEAGNSYGPSTHYATAVGPTSVAIGDFNEDGDPDLAVATVADKLGVLIGQVGGSFLPRIDFALGASSDPSSVKVADLNGDGDLDAVTANQVGGTVSVFHAVTDAIAPETTIDSGPGGLTNSATPTFGFSSSEAGSTFECRVDSAAFAPCTTPFTTATLAAGPHSFSVRATDTGGNADATPASRSFTVDLTPPETIIDSGPTGVTNVNTQVFTFSASEGPATFQCRVGALAFAACTSPYTTEPLGEGAQIFEVRAIDGAGNTDPSPAARLFSVDTVAPNTTIDSGPNGLTGDNTPTFGFTATQTGSTFQCRVDGAPFATCTTPFTTAALTDGAHTFEVRATDPAGNTDTTPASRAFTVATNAPDTSITSGPGGPTNDNTPTFAFTATEAGSTFTCRVDTEAFATCASPFTTGALTDGAHTFEVRATSAAGATDPTPASRSFTVDTVAPDTTLATGPDSVSNDTTPTFSFTSTEAGSTFECHVDSAAFVPCGTPFTTGALADGAHTFQVRAVDPAGNADATPASQSFTVDATAPDTSISAGPSGPTNDSTPTFSFSASEAGSTFACRVDAAAFASCTGSFTSAALGDGVHTFDVRATDAVGNTDPTPASRSFTVDTAAPQTTIGSGPAGPTNDTTPTFGFSSSQTGSTFTCRVDAAAFAPCTTPFTTGVLTPGAHTFEVRATDAAGNADATPATRSVTVDVAAPDTTIDSGPTGLTTDSTPTFGFSSSETGSAFECRVDAAAYASCTSPFTTAALSDGAHTVDVRAVDAAGNVDPTPASRAITVDAAAPNTVIDSGPSGPTNDTTPTFGFSSTEAGSTFACRVDGAAFTPCTTPFTSAALAVGAHTFEVRATDAAGNADATPASRSFTVDVTAPNTTIDSGPTGLTNDSTPTFAFSSSETGSTFQCRVDAAAFAPCTTPFTAAALTDGAHMFEVRATDGAGNVDATPAARAITVDATAPETTISAGPSGLTGDNTPTFTFTSEASATFQCRIGAAPFASCTSPFTTATLGDGADTFDVRATDAAGNTDPTPASRSFTVDTAAPNTTITSGPSGLTNDSTPTYAFSSEAGVTFQCRFDAVAYASCTSPFTAAALADGAHTFAVRATDAAGNVEAPAAGRSITVDATAPQTTIDSGPTGLTNDSTPTFAFSSSETGSTLQCRVDAAAFAACTSPFTTAALADGAHTFEVRATDAAGNIDATPAARSITVDASAPNTTIDSGPTGLTNDSSPTFAFSASETGSTFACRVDAAAFATCATPFTTATLGDGAHTFEVRATDAAGNVDATPAARSITVDASAPNTAIDSGPTGLTNDSSPTFAFSSSETGSTFACRVDAAAFATCVTPFTTATLTAGAHTFEVRATDAAGNVDATPAARSITVDAAAPQTTIDSGPTGLTNDSTPTFGFSSSETGSTFQCRVDAAAFATCATPFTTAALADGAHTFEVRAIDAAGNVDATPASRAVTVDDAAPNTTIDSGPTGLTNDSTPTFGFSSSETGSTFQCRVDAAAFATCATPFTTAALADGAHTFEVRATDAAGNVDATPAARSITVDTSAPNTTIDSGPTGLTNDSTPMFEFSSSETDSTFQCRVDAAAFALCTSPFTTAALADGAHTFEARATDAAGNVDAAPASRPLIVDITAPETTIDSGPTGLTTASPTFDFSSSEASSSFECRLDDGAFAHCTSPLTTAPLALGTHTFEVRSIDVAGNVDATPASRAFTVVADADGDGIVDETDNCLTVPNPSQANLDRDPMGDACDPDDDNDGIADVDDAFPSNAGESSDTDGDGIGNNADTDTDDDGDGIPDAEDAFPLERDGVLSGQLSRLIASNPAAMAILGPLRNVLLALGL